MNARLVGRFVSFVFLAALCWLRPTPHRFAASMQPEIHRIVSQVLLLPADIFFA
ncbi:TPA: hypothetical protein MYP81_003829 [Citrobacter farmeri]|uniref:hypothetical protein n=1 Tax=Citrobacter farmeri TaxID=67824 RepID=UPI001A2E47F2|nr:hypothetical protein [Citrobacter farmeri]HAT3757621.1 hypothetical protein [Citrobacter amalonaticus]HCB1595468.1 hypothetical protein [Citrobacter farmeri]HCB1652684.1 hypothetical protein [Citrobacter farmeri]HCB1662418.1 hypothetical protein [Citrobacter farmeri]HCB1666713.1 hypothetical protein [Citrobacter farmeri]